MLIRELRGFALPTIMISSIIMLAVLMLAFSAATTTRVALSDQHYNQLAMEAAESGIAKAHACLKLSTYVPQWTGVTDSTKLRPNTGCSGGEQCVSESCYVLSRENTRVTFEVGQPYIDANGLLRATSKGIVRLTRASNNAVWKEYTYDQSVIIRFKTQPTIASGAGWKNLGHNAYFLTESGVLYGWGDNTNGHLGSIAQLGDRVSRPVKVALPAGIKYVKKVYTAGQGAGLVCGIMVSENPATSDAAYCKTSFIDFPSTGVGYNWTKFVLPAAVSTQYPVDMALHGDGDDSICIITNAGGAYCGGKNYGMWGDGLTSPASMTITGGGVRKFNLGALTAQKIFVQDLVTCVLASNQRLHCSGRNDYGQLGRGNTSTNMGISNSVAAQVAVPGNPAMSGMITQYHSGSYANHFLAANGKVYGTGRNSSGTLGGTSSATYSTPVELTTGTYSKIISVGEEGVEGPSTICVITATQQPNSGFWCRGSNKFGQQTGTCNTGTNGWVLMTMPNGATVDSIQGESSPYHANSVMVISRDGDVYAAGDNTYGKLGTGQTKSSCHNVFRKVLLPSGVRARALSNVDEYTSYILTDDGDLYAQGRNNRGQLGNGNFTDSTVPVKVLVPDEQAIYY